MSNNDKQWKHVAAYANVFCSNSPSAGFAKGFIKTLNDGEIYRYNYSGSIHPFDVVPPDLFDWPEVD